MTRRKNKVIPSLAQGIGESRTLNVPALRGTSPIQTEDTHQQLHPRPEPSEIARILSKGEVGSGHRSRERARHLLSDFKQELSLPVGTNSNLDEHLETFLSEAVLGAAWYQKRCGNAYRKIWFYIIANCALVIGLPLSLIGIAALDKAVTPIPAQVTAVLTGILALQKTLSTWYSSQQRYAAWYKARSDLKSLYYAFVQTWSGKSTATNLFLPALQAATAAARKIIDDEQENYFQRLALPSFDVLDMLTSTRSSVATFVTSLLPGTPPASVTVAGKAALVSAAAAVPVSNAAVFSPRVAPATADGRWTTLTLPTSFAADVMLLLTDGSVLIHNADTADIALAKQWMRLTPGMDGIYETGRAVPAADMQFGRQWFASGVLRDGRVFIIGGEYCEDPAHQRDCPTGELFDPVTNAWKPIDKPSSFDFVCGDCNGTVLADGRVLLGAASPDGAPATWTTRTAVWDPSSGTWNEAGLRHNTLAATTKTDPFEEETFALLPDGSVLAAAVRDTPKAQRYVPALDAWVDCAPSPVNLALTTINSTPVFETGPAILLPSGKLFYVGGGGQTACYSLGPTPADPGMWQRGPDFPPDGSANPVSATLTALDAPGCLLPNGKVLLIAGSAKIDSSGDYFSTDPVFLLYDPESPASVLSGLNPQPPLPQSSNTWQFLFLLLPTGQLLCSTQTNTLYFFTPSSSPTSSGWMPAAISFPSNVTRGQEYQLSGIQINGLSQAVSYGDDAGMATNYPIVRLTNPSTGAVIYARTSGFSSLGVATGPTRQSCVVAMPDSSAMGAGVWHLAVVANGIASVAIEVTVV